MSGAVMSGAVPIIVVSSLSEACRALSLGVPVDLLSPPDAAAFGGAAWFARLVAAATASSGAPHSWMLDCGDRAGDALDALAVGCPDIIFTGPASVAERLAALTGARGGRLLRRRPFSLTLRSGGDPAAACREWAARFQNEGS